MNDRFEFALRFVPPNGAKRPGLRTINISLLRSEKSRVIILLEAS